MLSEISPPSSKCSTPESLAPITSQHIHVQETCQSPFQQWTIQRPRLLNGYHLVSAVLVCPVCTRIWCRLACDNNLAFHEARTSPCSECCSAGHPDLRPVAGSILDNQNCNTWDYDLLDRLPEDLLRREFALHMRTDWERYEREIEELLRGTGSIA